MKKTIIGLLFLLLLAVSSEACVILIYHKIGDNRTPSTNVSKELFVKQMNYLVNHHYTVIPLKQLVKCLEHKENLPDKCVVLTFDDGYRSVYHNAFPTLKKLSLPATVFLPTEAIEKRYSDYMTLSMIRKMMKFGIDFQSHSYAHPRFTNKPKGFSEQQYKARIKNDLEKSINFFVKNFGYKPYAFAIPYGDYNMTVINIAKELGFKAILTQDATALDKNTPLWLLPRQPILGKYWSTMSHFKEILNETYIDLKKRIPDIELCPKNQKIFGGVVVNIKKYLPNSFEIYISEYGWIKAKVNGNLVYINLNKPLHKKFERIGIRAKTIDGKIAKTLWMIQTSN